MSAERLELMFEARGLPDFELPAELAALYDGTLGFDEPCLYANFVSTLDGVVAIPSLPASNRLVAGGSSADRFLMGLLRACASAVVVGAGTLSASPTSLWTPARAFPDAADAFAALRLSLGLGHEPELIVLSASGLLDPRHPAFERGALVLTTDLGAGRLAGRLPDSAPVLSLGSARTLDPARVVAALSARGHRRILSEGGPHAIGPLLAARLVDELFLTISPLLLGRTAESPRLALVEGTDLAGGAPPEGRLLGIRRAGDHLFLRYDLRSR